MPIEETLSKRSVMIVAAHPDDETIVGALALRIFREARMNLIDVAVTQGSKKERQAERLVELQAACNYLGYGLVTTAPNDVSRAPRTRMNRKAVTAARKSIRR